ncbi:MAG TPA: AI-2E family transporter [Chloroflexia bacterium]
MSTLVSHAPEPASELSPQAPRESRLGLNRWLQLFLTIIAGTIVAVIAWTVIERFLHIIILMLASFLLAYLLGPLVDRGERARLPRILATLLVYLVIIGTLVVGAVLLIGPLTAQLQDLTDTLPTLVDTTTGTPSGIDRFFRENGIPLDVADLRTRILEYVSGAGTTILGGTLSIVGGLVTFVTDIFLILAITFYLLLDGRGMHNRMLRLLPAAARERWFFVEATLNRVIGGYIRGQILVALTVGVAAGVGSAVLGVQYPLVIGLLAFLFEFIPLVGPVLGMVPAVVIAFFQSPGLALWVTIYFIVLQQIEANIIVPRVSGHAVGLHPLAVLLALLAGVELGGLGGALLAVPVAGVLYVIGLALYSDATKQTELLVTKPRRTPYSSLRHVIEDRRGTRRSGAAAQVPVAATGGVAPAVAVTTEAGAVSVVTTPELAPAASAVAVEANERLATIAQDQTQLIAQFEAVEAEEAAELAAREEESAEGEPSNEPAQTGRT